MHMDQHLINVARNLDLYWPMARGKLIIGVTLLAAATGLQSLEAYGQVAAFKGGVDMVRVAAVVRDHKGRFVQDLTVRDFEVLDAGQPRAISDFRADVAGISVAILFDVSGSMEGHLPNAREAATHVLSWTDGTRDEAAIFMLSTRISTSGCRSRRVCVRCPIR